MAISYHLWKDETSIQGWQNNLTDTIVIQQANLTYPDSAKLQYQQTGSSDFQVINGYNYPFCPIKGDVNNDGRVDIADLRTVAAFFDQTNEAYNLAGDSLIDIYDLVVVASNFGFQY